MSNAGRQKRYRDKKRNAPAVENVTEMAQGVTVEPERNALADVPYIDLSIRLHYMRDWKTSPEYIEVMRRLHTFSVAELEEQGQFIPVGKYREAA